MTNDITDSVQTAQEVYADFIATHKASLLKFLESKPKTQEEHEQKEKVYKVGQVVVKSLLNGDINVADLGTTVPVATVIASNISISEMLKIHLQNQLYLQNQQLLLNLLSAPAVPSFCIPTPPTSCSCIHHVPTTQVWSSVNNSTLNPAQLAQYQMSFSDDGLQFLTSSSAAHAQTP